MATLASLQSTRAAAGAAYAAAAAAYQAAWIELQACDKAVENVGRTPVRSFGAQPVVAGHGEYLRDLPALTNRAGVVDLMNARFQQLLAS